jgi:hypothetical protein
MLTYAYMDESYPWFTNRMQHLINLGQCGFFVKKIAKFGVDMTTEFNIIIYPNIVTAVGVMSETKF